MNAKELAKLAQENKVVEQPKKPSFFDLMAKGSEAKIDSLLAKFEELAKQGFGGAIICLDGTSEMFMVDEDTGCFYSESEVCDYLKEEGFILHEVDDYYHARDYSIVWDIGLPVSKIKVPYKI